SISSPARTIGVTNNSTANTCNNACMDTLLIVMALSPGVTAGSSTDPAGGYFIAYRDGMQPCEERVNGARRVKAMLPPSTGSASCFLSRIGLGFGRLSDPVARP
ncbi:MAG: hypothetical protein ACE5EQ_08190, partial [Phycisphaerae bacterium]